MNFWTQNEKNIYVAAHRGWSERYPENTLIAFASAIGLGVDQLELDIRVSRDNQFVIIHDERVDRTTNGEGRVCDFTLSELKALDAGIHKGEEFEGERIPTLIELMELIKSHPTLTLDIELKEYPTDTGKEKIAYEVCDRVIEIIEEYSFGDRVVINSFSNPLNEYVFKKYSGKYRQHVYYPIQELCGPMTIDPYSYAYCACMFKTTDGPVNIASPAEFASMRALGPQPWAGASVKDELGVDLAILAGASLITCNNPDFVLRLLCEKGYHK